MLTTFSLHCRKGCSPPPPSEHTTLNDEKEHHLSKLSMIDAFLNCDRTLCHFLQSNAYPALRNPTTNSIKYMYIYIHQHVIPAGKASKQHGTHAHESQVTAETCWQIQPWQMQHAWKRRGSLLFSKQMFHNVWASNHLGQCLH